MRLKTRSWGPASIAPRDAFWGSGPPKTIARCVGAGAEPLVCVHGLAQHGGIFAELGERLTGADRRTVALDLRGHGGSGPEPPWHLERLLDDLLETMDAEGIATAAVAGHSFGGVVAAALAARAPERVSRLALLDPGFGLSAEHALKSAEMDRLDWSFGSVDGAVNALLAADTVLSAPREKVEAFAAADLRRGVDGRLRFSFCPCAVVVAWSEMSLPPPPVAQLPTLLLRPVGSIFDSGPVDRRYREERGSLLTRKAVPHGHNMLWESPQETIAAIAEFLAASAG